MYSVLFGLIRLHRRAVMVTAIVSIFGFSSGFSEANTLPAGCRTATASDLRELEARGLPSVRIVCPKDAEVLGIGQNFDQWYAKLKSQSPCHKTTCNLSCRTRNTGAQVCGTTSNKWSAIGCHSNNRTAIFPTVAHGFAAHIELLRRYCGERGRCTINAVVGQWTAIAGHRPAYAAFASRNSGIPVNQVFDPNDTELVARLALAMSCFEGGALPFSAEDLKKGIAMASGGARVPVPSNVGELLEESLQGSYAPNTRATESVQPLFYQPPAFPNSPSYTQPPYSPTPPTSPPPPQYSQPPSGQPSQYLNNAYTSVPPNQPFPPFGSPVSSSTSPSGPSLGQGLLDLIKPITTGIQPVSPITVISGSSSIGSISPSKSGTQITIASLSPESGVHSPAQTFSETYLETQRPSESVDVVAFGRVLETLRLALTRFLEFLRLR